MAKVNDLPLLDRPREKALFYGIETLADHELLALLIGSGSKDSSAIDIAYFMLRDNNGLYSLVNRPLLDLQNYKGMGKAKAIKLSAAFEIAKRFQNKKYDGKEVICDSGPIYQRMKKMLGYTEFPNQEILYLVILDGKKKIVHQTNLYKGTESSVNVSTMQVIQQVIIHSGQFFYLVHNHPSGNLEPSDEDIFFTTQLVKECPKFDITMLDHLIISNRGYYSFLRQKTFFEDQETM